MWVNLMLVGVNLFVARKVKAVEDAVVDLFRSTGSPVDTETLKWVLDCWDKAVLAAGEVPE